MTKKHKLFSIIVVSLNAGDKLLETVNSILIQDYHNYEIIIKDGESKDGSLGKLKDLLSEGGFPQEKIRLLTQPDKSIYDAMNQAILKVEGEYILFLNCGDTFPAPDILSKTADFMKENPDRGIYYGDTFCEQTNSKDTSPKRITPFVCYRNIPCHQSCFYKAILFEKKQYDMNFRIRADYDHFLWCCLKEKTLTAYMDMTVASYEGGGYSENAANRKRDKEEHRMITKAYLTKGQRFMYGLIMMLTLAPLRRFLANNSFFSGFYHKVKAGLYR